MTSCLTPLGNVHGKHVVTVEGINQASGQLTPVQQAIVDHNGAQCGFCTVGFVMSLTGHSLSDKPATEQNTRAAIDGNICRCTGYKSLERAAASLAAELAARPGTDELKWLSEKQFVPSYFEKMPAQLAALRAERLDELRQQPVRLLFDQTGRRGVRQDGARVVLGAATTASQLLESEVMRSLLPRLPEYLKLVSSTPIRNMGTVAGNFINASPIGDLTILFLALGADITLADAAGTSRSLPLDSLYLGYKKLAKAIEEQVTEISFPAPQAGDLFNFEKVSKRTHLDIASVNTSAWLRLENGVISAARLSAGGVGPAPLLLARTGEYLIGRELNAETV
nr:xanthine dehydrogenase [Tanacetum cinerariifolium]